MTSMPACILVMKAAQYLPCIHQLADLVQGRPIWRIKSPTIEDSTWYYVLRCKQRKGNNYKSGRYGHHWLWNTTEWLSEYDNIRNSTYKGPQESYFDLQFVFIKIKSLKHCDKNTMSLLLKVENFNIFSYKNQTRHNKSQSTHNVCWRHSVTTVTCVTPAY